MRYSHMAHQCFYRIEVEGEVDTAWCHHSGNSAIMVEQREGREAVTVLLGLTSDQAALSRVLSGLHEQHIPVLSVDAIDTGDAASRAS